MNNGNYFKSQKQTKLGTPHSPFDSTSINSTKWGNQTNEFHLFLSKLNEGLT
jgi:hypothetical protein